LHLRPVDYLRVQIQTEFFNEHLNVVDGDIGVPSAVDVEH
jgi:hypothetical protein